MLFRGLVLLSLLTISSALGFTDLITELPTCALNCSIVALSNSSPTCGLAAVDATCLCTNTTLQYTLSTCIQGACNLTEQFKVQTINLELCPSTKGVEQNLSVLWTAVGLGVISLILVILRCYSRFLIVSKFWLDDWAIIAASCIYIAILVLSVEDHKHGFGRHIWQTDPTKILALSKIFIVTEILYIACLFATKLSILLLYYRVFTRKSFQLAVIATIVTLFAWAFSITFAVIFQCSPINGAWDLTIPSKCVNREILAYAAAAIGIAQDLIILFLPAYEIMLLQMKWKRKLQTLAMVGVGIFACITSIVRLKFLISFGNTSDPTWDNVKPALWSMIEINVAMVCACLPAVRALFVHWLPTLGSESRSHGSYSSKSAKISHRSSRGGTLSNNDEDGHELCQKESYAEADVSTTV